MARPTAPWWLYLVASSFIGFFCFTVYVDFTGPEPIGLGSIDFAQRNLFLKNVDPGSALERAGVREGDRILAVNRNPIRSLEDWRRQRGLFVTDGSVELEVERSGSRFHTSAFLYRGGFARAFGNSHVDKVNYFGWRGGMLMLLISALCLAFLRPKDLSVRLCSLIWAAVAASIPTVVPAYGWTSAWRGLPFPLAFLLAFPIFSITAIPILAFAFFAVFPADYFSSRRRLLLFCAPGLLLTPLLFLTLWPLYEPGATARAWELPLKIANDILAAIYFAGGYLILLLKYRKLQDQNHRRRIRAIIPATIISLLVTLHAVVAIQWANWFGSNPPLVFSTLGFAVDAVMFQIALLLLIYATFRHRIFEFSVIIRRGLQYATARKVLVSMVPASVALLVADLVLHREQPLAAIMQQRGWFYAIVGAAAFVATKKRDHWISVLDKRFFRERYDAQHILRQVAEEVRGARSLDEIAPHTVMHIETALHPDFVALMIREPESPEYRCVASAPAGAAPRAFSAESKLMSAFRLFAKPLQLSLSESGWLQQLPHQDTEFLRQSHADLLVPIAFSPGAREALLMLGVKKSEEPYSSEDRELLLAIANGLAMLLERPVFTTSHSGLGECPLCGSCYDSGIVRCVLEGAQLKPSPAPRLLVSRYRLERRLGSGGMGTVYKAMDTSLDRAVAIKLIRDDLVTNSDIAERFRREGKAAASLSHPNLVTVYDFGIDGGTRAFLIMELLEGQTLRQELQRHKRLSPARTLEVLRPICAAVEAAHEKRIIHRDLKAENIFLTRSATGETPKVLDFGLAKFAADDNMATQGTLDTAAGVLVGTPQYMSPEQLNGEGASPAWDLWALSVIAYEALTGALPFNGNAIAQIHNAISNGRFTPVSQNLPGPTADRISNFFTQSFSLDSADRPSSARALLSELEKALENAGSVSV